MEPFAGLVQLAGMFIKKVSGRFLFGDLAQTALAVEGFDIWHTILYFLDLLA
jgi:hypothetical protein